MSVVSMDSAAPRQAVFAISAQEISALSGCGPLAFLLYVHLRAWMDYRTGLVGVTRGLSLDMLATYAEQEVPRGAGVQRIRPTKKQVRTALDVLLRADLLLRRATETLVFLMPLALTENVRPFQTGHSEGTSEGTLKANGGAGFKVVGENAKSPNRAHIKSQGLMSTLTSSSSESELSRCSVDKSDDDDDFGDEVNQMPKRAPIDPQDAMLAMLADAKVETNGDTAPLARWVESGRGLAQLKLAIAKAKEARAKAGSIAPIGLGYINTIIMNMHPAKAKATSKASAEKAHWRSDNATVRQMARSLKMSEKLDPKTGKPETIDALAERIAERLRAEGRDE